jgi:hypothetical protein
MVKTVIVKTVIVSLPYIVPQIQLSRFIRVCLPISVRFCQVYNMAWRLVGWKFLPGPKKGNTMIRATRQLTHSMRTTHTILLPGWLAILWYSRGFPNRLIGGSSVFKLLHVTPRPMRCFVISGAWTFSQIYPLGKFESSLIIPV